MDTNDRCKRLRELEGFLRKLSDKGWRVDSCQISLADSEGPFRAVLQVAFEEPSVLKGVLGS